MAKLRRILGVTLLDKIRNECVRSRLDTQTLIVQLVYDRQHRWCGHVLRMNNNRIALKVLQGKTGKRQEKAGKTKVNVVSDTAKKI